MQNVQSAESEQSEAGNNERCGDFLNQLFYIDIVTVSGESRGLLTLQRQPEPNESNAGTWQITNELLEK